MHKRPESFDEINCHLIDGPLPLGPRVSGWKGRPGISLFPSMSRGGFLSVAAAGIFRMLTGGRRPRQGLANCPAMFARKLNSRGGSIKCT